MNEIVKYTAGDSEISLSTDIVRRTITVDPCVTDQEIGQFIQLCRYQKLNPYLGEAYLVKYKSKDPRYQKPASIIVGKQAFERRATSNIRFRGLLAGVYVMSNNQLVKRTGSMVIQGETIVGGWCEVHVDGYEVPVTATVSFNEYAKDTNTWKQMPGTMIRKVAEVQALREAFPADLEGMYIADEMRDVKEEPQKPDIQHTEVEAVPMPEDIPAQDIPSMPDDDGIVEIYTPEDIPNEPQETEKPKSKTAKLNAVRDLIAQTGTDLSKMLAYFKASKLEALTVKQLDEAAAILIRKIK